MQHGVWIGSLLLVTGYSVRTGRWAQGGRCSPQVLLMGRGAGLEGPFGVYVPCSKPVEFAANRTLDCWIGEPISFC
jgi:hypothetical protein